MGTNKREYAREYYQKNKERMNARSRELYEERKEEMRELGRLRYYMRKEKMQMEGKTEKKTEEKEKKPRERHNPDVPLGRPRLPDGSRIQSFKKRMADATA